MKVAEVLVWHVPGVITATQPHPCSAIHPRSLQVGFPPVEHVMLVPIQPCMLKSHAVLVPKGTTAKTENAKYVR